MSWSKDNWRKEVAIHLFEMVNIKFQKDIWLNNLPRFQSDFISLKSEEGVIRISTKSGI